MPHDTAESKVIEVFAFSSPDGGGNPAGIYLDADEMTPEQMQKVATQAGFSETAFVSQSSGAGFRLDFFTPAQRIIDCGHATVAAFSVLAARDTSMRETSKELFSGAIRKIRIDDSKVFMEQLVAQVQPIEKPVELFSDFFSSSSSTLAGWVVRHDVGFLIFELSDESQLSKLKPHLERIKTYTETCDCVGIYVFVKKQGAIAATTRMFAPAYGIDEESATGMAAGLLAAILHSGDAPRDLVIEQGRYMKPASPSLIECKVRRAQSTIWVGGSARLAKNQSC